MYDSCVFEGARVELGGAPYHRCTFKGCLMVVDGRAVDIDDCAFEGCSWTFEGPAGNAMGLLRIICRSDPNIAAKVGVDLGILPGDGTTKH